jgi:hypothetical protein
MQALPGSSLEVVKTRGGCYLRRVLSAKRARSCQVRAPHRFSADERRRMRRPLERLGIELI